MDFATEGHVRIYRKITPTARLQGFHARQLMHTICVHADLAGVIRLPDELLPDVEAAISVMIDCPDVDYIRSHLPPLLERGSVEIRTIEEGTFLVVLNYLVAQYCTKSKAKGNQLYRQKVKDIENAIQLGLVDETWAQTG